MTLWQSVYCTMIYVGDMQCFELLYVLAVHSVLLSPLQCVMFDEVPFNITDVEKTSVSLFFFGVKATTTAFRKGSNIVS